MLSGIPCMLSPLRPWGWISYYHNSWPWGSLPATVPAMQKDASPLGIQSFISLAPPSHQPIPVPIPPWSCVLPSECPHPVYGKHVLLPQRTSGGWAVPHTVTSLCCAARTASLSYTPARPEGDSIHPVPPSSPSHYHRAPHLWGSAQMGGRGVRGNTSNWFKNSPNLQQITSKTLVISNFLNLFIPTDGC